MFIHVVLVYQTAPQPTILFHDCYDIFFLFYETIQNFHTTYSTSCREIISNIK